MAPSFPGNAEIGNKVLIEEIKKRPVLYDRNMPGYSQHEMKKSAWHQIGKNVFPDQWLKWNQSEKTEAITGMQKRWNNLRTSFARCYKKSQKKKKTDLPEDEEIQYRYFDNMSFIVDHLSLRPDTDTSNSRSETRVYDTQFEDENQDWPADDLYLEESSTHEDDYADDQDLVQIPNEKRIKKEFFVEDPEDPLNVPKRKREAFVMENKEVNTDQDVNFAMSLVPMLRELSLTKKLQAQIEILKVFQNITSKGEK